MIRRYVLHGIKLLSGTFCRGKRHDLEYPDTAARGTDTKQAYKTREGIGGGGPLAGMKLSLPAEKMATVLAGTYV